LVGGEIVVEDRDSRWRRQEDEGLGESEERRKQGLQFVERLWGGRDGVSWELQGGRERNREW
jgi:hypothetical protein